MFTSLIAASLFALNAAPSVSNAPNVSISPAALEPHVRYLASPELEGRMTMRPGNEKAAAYIAENFKRIGLEAREADGSYMQRFDLTVGFRMTKNNMAVLTLGDGKRLSLNAGVDFVPMVGSRTRLVSAPIVWLGYGNETDYENVNLEGKVAMMFRGAQDGRGRTNAQKARTASEKGAAGVIFIGPPAEGRAELPALSRGQGISDSTNVAAIAIHQKYFKDLVGADFANARKVEGNQTKELKAMVRMVGETEVNAGKTMNVIGYLPGTDPNLKNEFIIIGGHFDHLGFGETGSRTGNDGLHAGADDNASGTAGVIAAAEWFKKNGGNRRTIIFQAYTGEELGLLGSDAWAAANPEILKMTSGMLNMDMIGTVRFDQTFVFGLSSSTEWLPLFSNVKVDGLRLLLNPHTRGDSDQASFIRRNVPSLFFHTGLTDEYHTEKDLFDKINFAGAAKVVEAVIQTALQMDARAERLPWNPQVERGNRPNDRQLPKGPMESPMKPPAR